MKLSDLFPGMQPFVQNLPNLFPAWVAADSEWMLAMFGAFHLLALAGMGGCALIIATRLMGANLTSIPSADVEKAIRPWFYGAVILGLVTGAVMGMATASRNYPSPSFFPKMLALIAGIILTFGCVSVVARQNIKDLSASRIWAMVAANFWLLTALAFLWAGFTYWAFAMVIMGGLATLAPGGAGRKPALWIIGGGVLAVILANIIPTLAFYEQNMMADGVAVLQSNGKPVTEKIFYWHLLTADTKLGFTGFVTVIMSESLRVVSMKRISETDTETKAATYTFGFAMAFWLLAIFFFSESFDAKPGAVLVVAAGFVVALGLSGIRTRLVLVAVAVIVAIVIASIAYSMFPLEIKCPIPMPADTAPPEDFEKQMADCEALTAHNRLVFNTMHIWAVRAIAALGLGVIGWQLFGPAAKRDTTNIAKMVGLTTFIVWVTVGALGRWIAFAS
jgi:hypothetical protein